MSRCIICNFCPDTDNQPSNFLVNPELCMQCAAEIEETTFYDDEDLESEDGMPIAASRKPVQTDLVGACHPSSQEEKQPLVSLPWAD